MSVAYTLFQVAIVLVAICCAALLIIPPLALRISKRKNPHLYSSGARLPTVAFFHPYCHAGGGGERVLWVAIRSLQTRYPGIRCVVYTGDRHAAAEEILCEAKTRFNIVLDGRVEFVYLTKRRIVEADIYPYFTLLGQSLGSIILAFEALFSFVPDIYIDSMGYAFSVPVFRYLGSSRTVSYVHYPTISTDMHAKVSDQVASFNNARFISNSTVLTNAKLIYYKIFAFLYGLCGARNDVIMVNSTWTYNHICSLWQAKRKTTIVYPPCDIEEFIKIPIASKRTRTIVSIAQFRPEKNHSLQIRSFAQFLRTVPCSERSKCRLILVGSCRNSDDNDRVVSLESLARELEVDENVDVKLNVEFGELKSLLASATIGLHTMRDEHFGIGIVECMAAGTVVLAHNSGGPKLDIVVDHKDKKTGFLAISEDTYAQQMKEIFELSDEDITTICQNARDSVTRFSDYEFSEKFISLLQPIIARESENSKGEKSEN